MRGAAISGHVSVASAWANISGTSEALNADKTIVGGGMLLVSISGFSSTGGNAGLKIYVNSVAVVTIAAAEGAHGGVHVRNGDTVHFGATKGVAGSGTSADWTVNTNVSGGASFTVSVDAAP
jgi:hypothetical protein